PPLQHPPLSRHASLTLSSLLFFLSLVRPPPSSTLFPYATLFRSPVLRPRLDERARVPVALSVRHVAAEERPAFDERRAGRKGLLDRKSTRLNSSHRTISYAVFCLKKKKRN